MPGYGPRLIAAENAAIAFPAGLSGADYFFGGSSRGSAFEICREGSGLHDSSLEGSGLELSVPRQIGERFRDFVHDGVKRLRGAAV